ncbi:hypothetical protein [Fannyhessea vaginae]|uniref:hypothetical protein n=1 Tax=Fannyhessea vaginae TaxID=82135 RepID=UPI00288AB8AB|nr:hypothetical protein [Fannyhessea vaginae]
MSRYKLAYIDTSFIVETIARTGIEQLLTKDNRPYVGIYDSVNNWYIPLRSNIGFKKPIGSYYRTPFKTNNPHFVNPGLDFQKSLFVPSDSVIEIRNTLPREQAQFIESHLDDIQQKFESYVLSVDSLNHNSPSYLYSTIALFPEGVEHLKQVIAKRKAKRPCSLSDDLQAATQAANRQQTSTKQQALHRRKL